MEPRLEYLGKTDKFWSAVKFVSQSIGYSSRKTQGRLIHYTVDAIEVLEEKYGLHIEDKNGVVDYLNYRTDLIERRIQPLFMNREEAEELFTALTKKYKPTIAVQYNKQKGEKRHPNYFTGIVNILTEKELGPHFDFSPRELTITTDSKGVLTKTFSRWFDGAYPSTTNPTAIWEIKEYYGTTTFGSRVADGVYETLLDGHEIREFEMQTGRRIHHYLFVDDRYTWWTCGKSYICRLVDMMHMGLVDEVLFGREVAVRWRRIIRKW